MALLTERQRDPDQFRELTEPLRGELQAYCYRMVGSLHDAEDLVQEVLIKAWRGIAAFRGESSLRSWLYRIATNACIDALRRRSRRGLPSDVRPPADPSEPVLPDVTDPIWLEPFPDSLLNEPENPETRYCLRETISLAFLAAVQYLSPRQRAVLILRDALGWSAAEVAAALSTTVPSVTSLLQRARAAMRVRFPAGSDVGVDPRWVDKQTQSLVERFVRAWHAGDVAGLVALLTDDAVMTMPPTPSWYRGRDALAAFFDFTLLRGPLAGRLRLTPAGANLQPAVAVYRVDPATGAGEPFALKVLTVEAGLIAAITGFVTPALFPRFGLPDRLGAPN